LSLIAEHATGSRLGDFFQQQIAGPIGVTSLQWAALGTHSYASAYAKASARDLARIAYLMLRRGSWNGQTIVSSERIDEMTRWDPSLAGAVYGPQIQFPTDPETHLRYGHMVWTNRTQGPYVGSSIPADAYYMAGFRTKFVLVIPSLDLIVVRMQDGPGAWSDALFTTLVAKVVEAAVTSQPNSPPTVELTAPANGSSFTAPADITIAANASDSDGTVAEVAFLADGNVVGTSTSPPYEIIWQAAPPGSFTLTARSTDDRGASATSAGIDITVDGDFAVLPDSISFGNQLVNVPSAIQEVVVQNTGQADLPVGAISLEGAQADQFAIENACSSSLPPGGSCSIGVQFEPTSAGAKSADLLISAGAAAATIVSLSGSGVNPANAAGTVSPTSMAFGSVRRGTSSTKQVTIRNTGAVLLPIDGVSLGGEQPGQFRVSHDCGASVAVGGSCKASVTFRPSSRGQKKATLRVAMGGGAGTKTVALKGTGT
jgi:hypothetical protein